MPPCFDHLVTVSYQVNVCKFPCPSVVFVGQLCGQHESTKCHSRQTGVTEMIKSSEVDGVSVCSREYVVQPYQGVLMTD